MYRLKINYEETPIQQFDYLPSVPFVIESTSDGSVYLVSQNWSGMQLHLTQLNSQDVIVTNIGVTYRPSPPEDLLNDINEGIYVVKKSNLKIE